MIRAGLRRAATPLRIWWRRNWFYRRLLQGPAGRSCRLSSLGCRAAQAGGSRQPAARPLPFLRRDGGCARRRVGVRSARRPARPGTRRCTALPGCRPCPMPAATMRAQLATNLIGQWVKRNARLFRAGLAAAHHGAAAGRHLQPWPAGDPQFRDDVALAAVRLLARTVPDAGAHIAAKRPTACRGWKRPRCWRCRASAWTTAPSGREAGLARLEEEIERQILPDGGHVSRSPEALLAAYRHLIMVMEAPERGGRGAAARLAQCP